jgi:transcriptional regulator with XRE-family HTH domain
MAENLWALREQKRLSVATLASRAGLPIGLIMEYESGQRSIDPRHLNRIARALYVEESQVQLHSDPRPGSAPLERQTREDAPGSASPRPPEKAPARPRERPVRGSRPPAEPRPPAPVRPSQITHLQNLLIRIGRTQQNLEAELGKPLTELDRLQASRIATEIQNALRDSSAERHRAYLPEAVDQYEMMYLMQVREANALLHIRLFDDSTVTGRLIGFGAYSLTLQQEDDSEITVNKLAIVSYTRALGADAALPAKEQ